MTGRLVYCRVCLVACVLLPACLCSDEVVSEVTSPDGVLTATIVVRDCGATTDFTSIVNLHKRGEASDDKRGIVFVAKGRQRVFATWRNDKLLSITCESCAPTEISYEASAWGDIEILSAPGSPAGSKR